MPTNAAFVTLLTKPSYLAATLVLEHSLRSVASAFPLVVMVSSQLPERAKSVLRSRNIKTREIDDLRPPEGKYHLAQADERFKDTWTKLRVFGLVEYDRVVLLDADMIVRKNMDELMQLDLPQGWIAGVHACACNPRHFEHYPADWIPENCAYTPLDHPTSVTHPTKITPNSPRPYRLLNSGGVVLHPSHAQSIAIDHFLATSDLVSTFIFPDQDLLAKIFEGKWKPLPYVYNALKHLRVIHGKFWRDGEVKCLHYVMADKPWISRPRENDPYVELNRWWWTVYESLKLEMRREGSDWQYVDQHVGARGSRVLDG